MAGVEGRRGSAQVLALMARSTVTGGVAELDESTWCAIVICVAGAPVTAVITPSASSPLWPSSTPILVASLLPSGLVVASTSTMSPTLSCESEVMPSLNWVLASVAKTMLLVLVWMVKFGAAMAVTLP